MKKRKIEDLIAAIMESDMSDQKKAELCGNIKYSINVFSDYLRSVTGMGYRNRVPLHKY